MLTQEYLKSVLNYDQETGIFTWKEKISDKIVIGKIAGSNNKGYIQIRLNKKLYFSHRLAWLYVYGEFPKYMIDHINNNPADNRICNLREATNQQNQFNRKLSKANTSGIKGVCWSKQYNKWIARIRANGKRIYLGCFDNLEFAELVVKEARNKFHGIFAKN